MQVREICGRPSASLLTDSWEEIRGFAINIAIVLGTSANFHPQDLATGSALTGEAEVVPTVPTRPERDLQGDL